MQVQMHVYIEIFNENIIQKTQHIVTKYSTTSEQR